MTKNELVTYMKNNPKVLEAFKSKSEEEQRALFDKYVTQEKTSTNVTGKKNLYQREAATEKLIKERAISYPELVQRFMQPGAMPKVMTSVQAATIPGRTLEALQANPLLDLQAGKPQRIPMSIVQAIIGKRMGEYGDMGRVLGLPEPVNEVAGLAYSIAMPAFALTKALNIINKFSKFSDKGLLKAGEQFVASTDEATNAIGKALDVAYKPVGAIKAKGEQFLDVIVKAPKELITEIEEQIGKNLDDVAGNIDINMLRKIKGIVGKYRPGVYGKGERNLAQTIEGEKIVKLYSNLKNLMQETLNQNGKSAIGSEILAADDAFSLVKRASTKIKKTIVDPDLLKPTKGGSAANQVKGANPTFRYAANVIEDAGKEAKAIAKKVVKKDSTIVNKKDILREIKRSGREAQQQVTKAMNHLKRYNALQTAGNIAGGAVKSAFYAGIIGSIGAQAARKVLGNRNQ